MLSLDSLFSWLCAATTVGAIAVVIVYFRFRVYGIVGPHWFMSLADVACCVACRHVPCQRLNSPAPAQPQLQVTIFERAAYRFSLITLASLSALCIAGFSMSTDRVKVYNHPTPCASDDLPCLLATVADSRHRVAITVATEGFMPLVWNLLASWQVVDLKHGLVIALDNRAATLLRSRGVPVYWDPVRFVRLDAPTLVVQDGSGALKPTGDLVTRKALRYETAEFNRLLRRINVLLRAVIAEGYSVILSDADTVWHANILDEETWGPEPHWEQDRSEDSNDSGSPAGKRVHPHLGHTCAALRLGDVVSPLGEQDAALTQRNDCPGGLGGQWMYDAIGMYGDVGG